MTPNELANQVLLQFSFEGKQVIGEAEFLTVREIELAQAYLALESRIQKLEAVAEAARDLQDSAYYSGYFDLDKALEELEKE